MTFDLLTIPANEAERVAYAEGFTRTATLFARIDDLERDNDPDTLRAEIAKLEDDNATLNDALENLETELADAYKAHRDARCEVESLQAELSALRWLER